MLWSNLRGVQVLCVFFSSALIGGNNGLLHARLPAPLSRRQFCRRFQARAARAASARARQEGQALLLPLTHAGSGRYDLTHRWAQKAREYENGIGRLWERKDIPPALAPYLEAVKAENTGRKLRFYPGSPLFAKRFARPADRHVLTELNKTDCAELEALFARDRQVSVHLLDGYQGLKAFLPPKERRGLALIDSSFDRAGEFARITTALADAHTRWATGTYAIWYPLMAPGAMRNFERDIGNLGIRKILKLELQVQERSFNITIPGCGMLLVNPPFRFEDETRPLLRWLWGALSVKAAGGASVNWLVPE